MQPVAPQHADQGDTDQDQGAVAEQDAAPAVRLIDLGVQYDDGRAEDGTRYRKPRGQAAVSTKPPRDDHGPGNRMADPRCSQGNDHEEERKRDDAGGEAKADEADAGDDSAQENQFTRAEAVQQAPDSG